MIIGIPAESYPLERRVALVPLVIPTLTKAGFEVLVETNAGQRAGYLDSHFTDKGAKIAPDRATVFAKADILIQVLSLGSNDVTGDGDLPLLRKGQILIGFLRPFGTRETLEALAARGVTSFSIELMPRITRAQSMDALSSMGTVCGYKAVLAAADHHPRLFPMMTT
ncbi:MAG TPA: NAD(P)(+) transhydrogenase (Re/Si-specific) subunit alpha, partial [Candidatus Dormibacteraeota bacterium]|nr:NAD(P)(+) transhydrogenase (Re/Si-specific) subunit alpha [Candidatus Dormibacteraeota bacterium]